MAVRIRSLAVSGPVVVPLSTGEAVRLSPGQVTDELPAVTVANNAKVEKLQQRGLIEVETLDEPAAEAKPDKPADKPAGKARSGKASEPSASSKPSEPSEPSG